MTPRVDRRRMKRRLLLVGCLFPLLACRSALGLNALDIAAGVAIFLIGEILISRVLFRLRLRDRPY